MDGEQHRAELSTGHRVTYLVGQRTGRRQLCRRGVVTGAPVTDDATAVTWVPVQVDGQARDANPQWISADAIIDVVSAS
ncbi:hypothetical protein [Amycolatopsis echigonensis]|uniref:Uncharacterized protein n=1 Tax=Amycolatopsis echigonensis TaxID=2576905 RepID=A0A2N3WC50_9PSEU|nr:MULTISPECIES: hypothetical protein [Amycolatopsis]MBB2505693.1 hypothetical protein [Amycolatopsis echigonensis]PKV91462.1 hypothetical protein ATK30_2236 [Amycolatopsis niigatensis]